ncbi:MAG: aminotransferase class III-fold pyridoxal phosphate-dependent enzyme [Mycobacterium pseudokansasii]|uniref:MupA/Atu3671 family FMN-dependent luciferase-like monooxygenase n=1 Tax=Mycobacterium pseudokansasii TaxID=2341080 RepID=UPI0023F405A6|nr:MupA/Atu3671 family FMN-dependent luciferase-like monooxygenase [Mycobacterium pseudokansasii]MBY0391455.1 aminotransferase class III-fold pyridoxal phosphate-dependent enzyme [Mycobacterium pseudokansasii]
MQGPGFGSPSDSLGEPIDVHELLTKARETLARQRETIERLRAGRREPVAVLGMGLRLPAGIETASQLWSFLRAGGDAITPIDDDGWNVTLDRDGAGRRDDTSPQCAALIADHDAFDPGYFSISPKEAAGMDPQQRMILEVTDRAFADAGVSIRCAARERTGAFVSTSSDDYLLQSADPCRRELFDAYTGTGTARAVAAGRLGHVFGLTGPILHVDTACSSSLVALHLACRSLHDRECTLAVVAAANLIAAPQNLLLRKALDAVAPRGRSRPFAEDAEGFGQGEGALAFVLQPLSAALAAGRRPRAIIRGSAVNHNGRGAGLTVPRSTAQREVMREALSSAGVDPDDVDLVEAHGTGTRLGDPIELAGLAEVYGSTGTVQLGSVKSNFGHLEAAAGLLSVAKVVLCMDNDEIPPTLHAARLNPEVPWDTMRFAVTTRPTAWPRRQRGRLAAISSFGMAGTNAHVTLADAPESVPPQHFPRPVQVLLVSGRSDAALHDLVASYAELLDCGAAEAFPDVCASSAVGRDHHRFRLVVVAPDAQTALGALRSWQSAQPSELVAATDADAPNRIVLVRDDADAATVDAALANLLLGQQWVACTAPAAARQDGVRVEFTAASRCAAECDWTSAQLDDEQRLAIALHLAGAHVDWSRVYPAATFTPVSLPAHPFYRRRLWITRPPKPLDRNSAINERTATMADLSPAGVRPPQCSAAVTAVAAVITGWIAELLGMQPDEVEPRRPLLEQGADSMVLVEVVSRVDTTFGVVLVLRQLFEELLTVAAITDYVTQHGGKAPSSADDRGDYLATLTDTYTRMTARSIAEYRSYLPVMCNNRRSASDVRPETAAFAAPLRVVSSRGAHLTDVDGNDYVDIAMGFGVNLFGHQAPFIVDAVREQLATGMQLGPESAVAGEVAALLAELTGQDRVLFCNSGTEAVMTMMRLARAHNGRNTIAVFRNAYHGHFDSTLVNPTGINDVSAAPMAIGIPPGLVHDVIVLPYADNRALAEIRSRGSNLAAVLVEPVQNRRPDLHPGDFLRELRDITRSHDVLLAFDEVLTGFRIHPGGAAAHFGVAPDIVSYAKVVGGGMPIGVVAGRADVMNRVDGGATRPGPPVTYTAGTFCRHPLAMAAARAVLGKLRDDGLRLTGRLNERTDELRAELNARFSDLGVPFAMHNFGSFFRFSINGNLSFAYQPVEMDYFNAAMLTKGVYIAEGGTCFLSTAHSDADIERVIAAAGSATRELRDVGLLNRAAADIPAATKRAERFVETTAPAAAGGVAETRTVPRAPEPHTPQVRISGGSPAPLLSLSFFGDYPRNTPGMFDVIRNAAAAADGRLATLWIPERHFHSFGGLSPNPSVLGAFLAGITTQIRIHAGSVVLPLHDPIRVAEEWAMIDNLSDGRIGVAFASGWQRNDFILAREPFDRRREVMWRDIDTVQRLWRGVPITFRRNGIEAEVSLYPQPRQADLPTWIAALGSPETFRTAGERGLSILTNLVGQSAEQLTSNIALYRDARRSAGIAGPGHVTALVHTLVTSDDSAARLARGPLHRYLGSSVDLFSAVTGSREHHAFERLTDSERTYLLDRAVDRFLQDNAIIGDLDHALDVTRRITGLGVDEIACFVDFGVAADDLLGGVDQLVRLRDRLQTAPRPPAPQPAKVSARTERARATADLSRTFDPDEITLAVKAAVAAEPRLQKLVEPAGPPTVHLVDLSLLDDAEQDEQTAQLWDCAEDFAARDCGEVLMIRRSGGRTQLMARLPGTASSRDAERLLDAVVSALRSSGTDDVGGVEAELAATPNEQLMWWACESDSDTARACHVRTSLEVAERLDIDALQEAVIAVAGRHQALRATFGAEGETLLVHRELVPVVHVVDFTALSDADRDEELARWYAEDAEQLIDVAVGPLWRIAVLRLAERQCRIVLTAHHIVFDGVSERIVLDELAAVYRGAAAELPAPVDFAAWRREHAGRATEADRQFWRTRLAGTEATRTAQLAAGPGGRLRTTLPAETVAALQRVAADMGCTRYVALLACYVMHQVRSRGGADAVIVGVSTDPRDAAARHGLIGYLSNLLPLRLQLDPQAHVATALPVVRAALLDAYQHQQLPFAEILSESPGTHVSTCFNWDHVGQPRFGSAGARALPDPASHVRFGLSLNVVETDDPQLILEWDYTSDCYDADGIARVAQSFADIVAELVSDDEFVTGETVHGRFAARAADSPATVAAYDGTSSVTFAELDACSDRIAAGLLSADLPGGAVVTIVGSLCVPMVAAMLGVLKAGAAFSVAAASTSEAALVTHMRACGSQLVIHTAAARGTQRPDRHHDVATLAESTSTVRLPVIPAGQAAYVVMTSGSIGEPKPVVVTHANLLSYLDALAQRVDMTGQRCLVVGSPAYDLCYSTLWSALTRGGTLLLADEDACADAETLVELTSRHPADVLKIAPTHLDALLSTGFDAFLPQAQLIFGGEPLRWPAVRRVRAARGEVTIWNHYGPTETTVGATMYRIGDPDPFESRATVPIGAALNGPVRVDGGELLVGGPGVAKGYLGLPAETAARFVWRSEPDGARTRWYRTGDVVAEVADGCFEFVGRLDDQVKVRGHRVELGAVDTALRAVAGVRAAAACVLGDGENACLAAGVVLDAATSPQDVRSELATTAPSHVIPTTLVAMQRLPRAGSGKLDRTALAAAISAASPERPAGNQTGAYPTDPLDAMTKIWRDVLERDVVSPTDDLFDLGGHSLHAIKIAARIRKVFGRRVRIRDVFDSQTPQALLTHITELPEAARLS